MTQQFMYDHVADATKHTSVKHTRLKHHGEQQWVIKKLNKFPISHLKYYCQTPTVMLKKYLRAVVLRKSIWNASTQTMSHIICTKTQIFKLWEMLCLSCCLVTLSKVLTTTAFIQQSTEVVTCNYFSSKYQRWSKVPCG